MEWSKVKNISLIMLLVTNLCLLFLLGGPEVERYELRRQNRLEAIAFLRQQGIELSEELVPKQEVSLPQVVVRNREQERRVAQTLLGKEIQEEIPGGEVYRYIGPRGVIQFHGNGMFFAELNPEAFPISKGIDTACLEVLKALSFEGEPVLWEEQKGTFRQLWNGMPLFQQQVTLYWNENGITQLAGGSRLNGTPVPDYSRTSLGVATALVSFSNGLEQLGDVCSQIQAIVPGYDSTMSLSGTTQLTPVWRVEMETGVYQLDLVNGLLSRVP